MDGSKRQGREGLVITRQVLTNEVIGRGKGMGIIDEEQLEMKQSRIS